MVVEPKAKAIRDSCEDDAWFFVASGEHVVDVNDEISKVGGCLSTLPLCVSWHV